MALATGRQIGGNSRVVGLPDDDGFPLYVYGINQVKFSVCVGLALAAQFARDRTRLPRNSCYSQRNTFAESAVQMTKTTARAATSPTCADHVSPIQIPWRSATA